MADTLTSNEVAALTGISLRQLQWWDERGLVVPARQGHRRLYSLDDLAEVAVIAELRRKGFSLQRMRKVVHFLRQELGKRLVETVSGSSDYHLLTDGRRIYVENSAQQVIDILKNARQPMFAVCLSDAVRRVHPGLRKSASSARGGGGMQSGKRVAAKLRA
ncbi:MAG TPA: MerR family transcriptional regulator [Terriglobales bacterium]|nr:MerR family transcriptional regulator [Terriglobales bacterium]